jgi:ferritin-like protein
MSSENLHEPRELLDEATINLHRAVVSLIEELEAVDWYQQRATACSDPELKAVLLHHRNEEIEHAMMNLEWIRRHDSNFDVHMRTYLFASGSILEAEEAQQAAETAARSGGGGGTGEAPAGGGGSLAVGSLRGV